MYVFSELCIKYVNEQSLYKFSGFQSGMSLEFVGHVERKTYTRFCLVGEYQYTCFCWGYLKSSKRVEKYLAALVRFS